uniref:F-box/LRR-repeat protein 15-like leucin rich repeat domain-containing protein n=1 Tax=Hyaloperonospora arabidopsidis (strain Emoy2) TaxID=559515 RepID=M4BKI3_HYAAE
MDDMLTLERVSGSWRRTLATASFWTQVYLDHSTPRSQCASTLVNLLARRHGPQVKRLTLVGCDIQEGLLSPWAPQFSSLTHLTVSGCQSISDRDFVAIIQASRNQLLVVRAVKCLRLTDAALQAMGDYHPQSLDRINFNYCRQISGDGVQTLARKCTNLRVIKIKSSPAATSSAVACIATHCLKLETLLVGGGRKLTDECLVALGDHCPRLTSLDVSRSNPFGCGRGGITDNALAYLVTRCPQLKHLKLCGQGRLTLSVLRSLATSSPKLETLDIGGCYSMISQPLALGAELKSMRRLHDFSVMFSRSVLRDQIDVIASQCPQLRELHVDGGKVVAARA